MRSTTKWMVAAVVVAGLGLMVSGCRDAGGSGEGDGTLVLRSYAVDPDLAGELETILNEALARGEGEAPVGRVSVGLGGRLIVAAPQSVLDAVEVLIADVAAASPPPPPVVTLTYWVAQGTPADATSWTNRLAEVAPALDAISSAEGPLRFIALEKAELRSLSGEWAQTTARRYRIEQRAGERDGSVLASITLAPLTGRSGGLQTRVKLTPGQLLVLGQTGTDSGPDAELSSIYIIVQAGLEP